LIVVVYLGPFGQPTEKPVKTSVERINPTRVKLTVEATPEELRPSIDHAYEHIAEGVNIPGFRKGKVPAAIIDKRIGRGAVLAHAINDGLNPLFQQAMVAEKLRPLSGPEVEVQKTPDEKTFEGDLVFTIEVEVRPEIKLAKLDGMKIEVAEVKVAPIEIDEELDKLRARFGTLKTVERAAKKGDFVSIDLTAVIDGKEVDNASNISYEIGSGNLVDGIDEALDTLTAGETTVFKSKLVGGEQAGKESEITVKLLAVKERELPEVNDEFAKLYSEFDTVKELKAGLEAQVATSKVYDQGVEARNKLTDKLLELVKVPVSEKLIEQEVHRHLEGEGRLEDETHRKEVTADSTREFQLQMILDEVADSEQIKPNEQEILEYLSYSAQNYGMELNEFIKIIDQNNQIPSFVSEVARRKALAVLLSKAEVVDKKGKAVDLTSFIGAAAQSGDSHEGHDHD
jgi:trigger factor